MVRALIRRLAESELDAVHRDVIGVASIARVVTAELLRDVLRDVNAVEALEWLRSRTFAEPLGEGVTLHDLVRRAARADLRQQDPERERELRRRIADHLYRRAEAGDLLLTVDLAALVETPELRVFYGWEGAVRNRIDGVRTGDLEQIALQLADKASERWWESTRRLFEGAPERVVVARDAGDNLCGFSIAVTPANAPPLARQDLLLGPWLEHAREYVPDGNVILWRDAVDFTGDPASGIQGMLNMVWVLRSGLSNPRYAYLPIDPDHPTAGTFAAALGAVHIEELDFSEGPHRVECHVLDYGEHGLLGMQRGVVYMELGLTPPEAEADPAAAPAAPDAEVVREALRNLRVPARPGAQPARDRCDRGGAGGVGAGDARGRRGQGLRRQRERGPAAPRAHPRLPGPRHQPRGGRGRAEPQPRRLFPAPEAGLGAAGGVPLRLTDFPALGASNWANWCFFRHMNGKSTNRRRLPPFPTGAPRTLAPMPLCFIEPQEAIRVVAEAVGREARRQLLGEIVRAWVDEIPDDELQGHYAKAVEVLDDDDLSMLAAWHASLEVGQPIANKDFLLNAFAQLGEHRREALQIAAGFRGEEAFEAGVSEEQALDTVLPWLSEERTMELAAEAVELYCWDRMGSDN